MAVSVSTEDSHSGKIHLSTFGIFWQRDVQSVTPIVQFSLLRTRYLSESVCLRSSSFWCNELGDDLGQTSGL